MLTRGRAVTQSMESSQRLPAQAVLTLDRAQSCLPRKTATKPAIPLLSSIRSQGTIEKRDSSSACKTSKALLRSSLKVVRSLIGDLYSPLFTSDRMSQCSFLRKVKDQQGWHQSHPMKDLEASVITQISIIFKRTGNVPMTRTTFLHLKCRDLTTN